MLNFSFKRFLTESPDGVILPNKQELNMNSDDAISFILFPGFYAYSFSKKDLVYGHDQLITCLIIHYLLKQKSLSRLQDFSDRLAKAKSVTKDKSLKEIYNTTKEYFHTYGNINSARSVIESELSSESYDYYSDFYKQAFVGRVWQNHKMVSYWGDEQKLSSYTNDLIGFIALIGDPREYKYELFSVEKGIVWLDYGDLTKRKFKTQISKNYEINGRNYSIEELRNMRIDIHVKGDKEAENFLCKNLTDDFLRKNPELISLKPMSCEGPPQVASNLQKYLKQGYNYPLFGDWNLNN